MPLVRQRKWWKETEVEESLPDLALINARSAVPIEIASGPRCHDEEPKSAGTEASASSLIRQIPTGGVGEIFLNEAHHLEYGRPWAMGRYVFDFAVSAGLRPADRLLDFGCGALRLGLWVIPYLDVGNYFGVDAHLDSLEAAATYEIPLHRLEEKRPRLLWNDDFAVSHFGATFDWIVDYSSASRIKDGERRLRAFANLAEVLAPGGHLLTSPRPAISIDAFEGFGLTLTRGRVIQACPLLEGHSFKSTNAWWEFVRK